MIVPLNNEQIKLHLYDISEAIQLKFSQEAIATEEDLNINYQNHFISIEPSLVEFAFAYEELNKIYQL